MNIEVAMAVAGEVLRKTVELPAGASIADALSAAGFSVADDAAVGVLGRIRALDEPVADGERVEIYAPLTADPKQARRNRARKRRPT